MTAILQKRLPKGMEHLRPLPGIQPVTGPWLQIDEAYAGQMAQRDALITDHRDKVIFQTSEAIPALQELLDTVLALLPDLGFHLSETEITCPDTRRVRLVRTDPLGTLGRLVQCDFCLHHETGDEHVLKAAILCFPASWKLSEKANRPLTAIHKPVDEYDTRLAARVQRLFDGVQAGRPLWRSNRLWYDDPELFQPRSETDPKPVIPGQRGTKYFRAERQVILRLPKTNWVVFAIHTYLLDAKDVPIDNLS